MNFVANNVEGCYVIEPHKIVDERGYFARAWCADELRQAGLDDHISQSNMAWSPHQGTLRGLHFQLGPHAETKILRCVRGSIFDVVVDLRPESPSYCQWFGVELNPQNACAIYVPKGCATGYLTLVDDAEIYYHTSAAFAPESASGVRFDDPAFAIEWPRAVEVISDADKSWPDYQVITQD